MANTEITPFDVVMGAIDSSLRREYNGPSSIYIGQQMWVDVLSDSKSKPYLDLLPNGITFRGLNVYVISNDLRHLEVV